MPIIQILRNTWSLGSTATSTNEEAGAPARFALSYRHSERWKSNNLSTVRMTLNAGSPKPFDAMGLFYHNGTGSGTFNITADNTLGNLFTTPAYAPAADNLRLAGVGEFISWHGLHEAASTQTYQYIGIQINDATNPDGYFALGVAYAGVWFTPALESDLGSTWDYEDLSLVVEMVNGEKVTRRRRRVAKGRESWTGVSELDKETFKNIFRTYSKSTPLIIRQVPDMSNYLLGNYAMSNIIYCFLTSMTGPTLSYVWGRSNNPLDLSPGPRYDVGIEFAEV